MQLLEHFKELTLHPKNAEELKGLILQLAVQGKLTENWRTENPDVVSAAVLLERIEKEKARLVKEKKIKKEKTTFSSLEDDMPFALPTNWEWTRLIEISIINGGFAFKSSNYIEEGARVIRISDFDELGFKNHKIVRHKFTEDLSPYVLESKNILLAMTGGTVGKSLFVDEVDEVMVVNQRVASIKIFQPVHEAYINCVIPTKLIQDVIEEAKNSTNDNISMTDIKGFKIPIPPLEEQKAIVEIVNELFTEVEQLEALTKKRISLKGDFATSALQRLTQTKNTNEEWAFLHQHFSDLFTEKPNIKKLRETILQLAVQGKLTASWRKEITLSGVEVEHASELLKRIEAEKKQLVAEKKMRKDKPLPPIEEDEKEYELPKRWVWCRLMDITTLITDGKHGNCQDESNSGYYFLSAKDVQNGKLIYDRARQINFKEFAEVHQRTNLKAGDLCIVNTGATVGKTAIVQEDEKTESSTFQKSVAIVKVLPQHVDITYLESFIKAVTPSLLKTSGGSAINNLLLGDMRMLKVPFPCYEEQQAIVEKVNSLMALCDELEEKINNSQTQIEQLMQSCLLEVFEN